MRTAVPKVLSDRRGEHGECSQEDLGRARLRCHALHVAVLWRRGRAARLLVGGRVRHDAGDYSPAVGCIVAYGMGLSDIRALHQRATEVPLTVQALATLAQAFAELEREARAEVSGQSVRSEQVSCVMRLRLKYEGTDSTLEVPHALLEQAARGL